MGFFEFIKEVAQGDEQPGGGIFGFLREDIAKPTIRTAKRSAAGLNPAAQMSMDQINRRLDESKRSIESNKKIPSKTKKKLLEELDADKQSANKDVMGYDADDSGFEKAVKTTGNTLATAVNLFPVGRGLSVAKQGLKVIPKIAAQSAAASAAGSAGQQLADNGKVDPAEVLKSAALGAAIGAVPPMVGAGKKAAQNAKLIRPSNLSDSEVMDLQNWYDTMGTPKTMGQEDAYWRARNAADKAKINYLDKEQINNLLQKHRDYDNAVQARKQKISEVNTILNEFADKHGLGLSIKDVSKDELANAKTTADVKKILNGRYPEEVVNKIAGPISVATDKNVIQKILDDAVPTPQVSETAKYNTGTKELAEALNTDLTGKNITITTDAGPISGKVVKNNPSAISTSEQTWTIGGKTHKETLYNNHDSSIILELPNGERTAIKGRMINELQIDTPTPQVSKTPNIDNILENKLNGKTFDYKGPNGNTQKAIKIGDNNVRYQIFDQPNQILMPKIYVDKQGTGLGSKFINTLKEIADEKGKNLVINNVENPKYFDKFSWLEYKDGAYRYSPTTPVAQVSKTAKLPNPLADLNDGQLMERNYIHNLQAMQGEGAQLPKPAGEVNPQVLAEAATPKVNVPEPNKDPFDEILDAVHGKPAAKGKSPVQGIASKTAEQAKLLSEERGARFRNVAEARKNSIGEEAYFKRREALKGSYTKVDFQPMVGSIGEDRTKELFQLAQAKIYNTPDSVYEAANLHPEGARFNTEVAVRKVLGLEPGLPTKSELKLLSLQSPKIAEEVEKYIPLHRKIFDAAGVLFGTARSSKSTADLSMGGRQGLFVSGRNPIEWARANKESVKYAANEKYYKQEMKAIHDDEWGKFIDGYDKNVLTGGAWHEEAYAGSDLLKSKYAKKIGYGHVVQGAERAYTGGITKLRKDLLVKWFKSYGDTPEEVEKILGVKGVNGLIEVSRTLTGRGGKSGGWISKNHEILSEALFSPKLWASRLEPLNPMFWKRIGPAGRKMAIENLGSYAAVAGAVLSAAVVAGATVETDPRSSDFLKIKVGDTRYDILGGFQQNIVFGARQALGLSNTLLGTDFNTTKSSQSGNMSKYGEGFGSPTQLSAVFDMLQNKANPVLGTGAKILEGKDKAGNKVNPLAEIALLFVPISVEGSVQGYIQSGAKGVAKNLPDFVGIGTQSYGTRDIKVSDKQQTYLTELQNSGAPKDQIEASKSFFQTKKTGPDRTAAGEAMKKALGTNPTQADMEKAIQIAKEYNQKYKDTFNDWREKHNAYRKDETLFAEYKKGLITDATIDRYLSEINGG